ncbi:MAG TPA: hypothetical protein VJ837_03050 [Candidatus Paceibacterota bacterium]|nr:hypothetical protein [Candidatus Paceibacterota bacterium]
MTEDPTKKIFEPLSEEQIAEHERDLWAEKVSAVIRNKLYEKRDKERERGFVEIRWEDLMAELPRDIGRDDVESVIRDIFSSPESLWRADIDEDAIRLTNSEEDVAGAN